MNSSLTRTYGGDIHVETTALHHSVDDNVSMEWTLRHHHDDDSDLASALFSCCMFHDMTCPGHNYSICTWNWSRMKNPWSMACYEDSN
jgi:hypothetical protein